MNKVILIGNLTRDPEITTTNGGVSVCRFPIAVQRRFQNAEGEREADFINIVVWRAQGENCHKFLKKGSKCGIVGRIQTSSYEGQDGQRRYVTEVVADEVEFISTSRANGDGAGETYEKSTQPKSSAPVAELEPIDDDSLPF